MHTSHSSPLPDYPTLLRLSIPVILANSVTPLLGMVDTAVLGHTGDETALGAIALSSLIFNFLYWGLGFLRMSTSGFVAQANGAGDTEEEWAVLARGLTMALLLGTLLLLLQQPILRASLQLFGGTASVESSASLYFNIRIWGAPASLSMFAIMGYLIGRGETRLLLWFQLLLNGCNIVFDVLFAGVFGWGVAGIALGTALSAWITMAVSFLVLRNRVSGEIALSWSWLKTVLSTTEKLRMMLRSNGDILVRTLFLLAGFAVFTDMGARFGDTILAANHVLLQFVSFSAFFLDGYAHVTESFVGKAAGAGKRELFGTVVKRSSILAGCTALCLALGVWLGGGVLVPLLTNLPKVQATALQYLPWACLYIGLSFAAFQLDGIFIGLTQTRMMRNASILSCVLYLVLAHWWTAGSGNRGLWMAFVVFVVARAVALLLHYPNAFPAMKTASGSGNETN